MSDLEKGNTSKNLTRRGFLTGIGAGAAGAAALQPADVIAQRPSDDKNQRTDRFTRMFDSLPPFAEATPAVERALAALGAPGGLMDAKDPLEEGPIRLITNPELSPNNIDNTAQTAGITSLANSSTMT